MLQKEAEFAKILKKQLEMNKIAENQLKNQFDKEEKRK